MPPQVEARIAGMRRDHPGWGPSRILWELERAGVTPLPGRPAVYRALIRHGLVDPKKRRRRREDYRRWERGRAMQLWQMDVTGRVRLAGGQEVKIVTGIDDHCRFVVCAKVVAAAAARPVCLALAEALRRHGVPEQVLTDNGKVFTARSGRSRGPVMFDRICADNGIWHLLTAPYSPTTTGKAERLHKTMRAEFFTPGDGMFPAVEELRAALDGWVSEDNTARPRQSCGGRRPIERFRLAGRPVTPDDSAAQAAPAKARPAAAVKRPAGVSRWVNARGKISLAGFCYHVGAAYAGEPVEAVAARGLADILHAGVVVATHAQRVREDQADRAPRAQAARRARDATAGVIVTRLAGAAGVVSFAGTPVRGRAPAGPHRHRRRHRRRLGAAVQGRPGHPGPPDPPRPGPRARRVRQPEGTAAAQELRHRQHRLTPGGPVPLAGGGRPASGAAPPSSRACGRCATACGRPGRASLRGPSGHRPGAGHKPARASTRPPPASSPPARPGPNHTRPLRGSPSGQAARGGTRRCRPGTGTQMSPGYPNLTALS
jgi:transposase InsO family protein